MESIEWAHARATPVAYGPYEELADGQCAANDGGSQDMALAIEGCAIWGTKAELLELLARASKAVDEFVFPDPITHCTTCGAELEPDSFDRNSISLCDSCADQEAGAEAEEP